MSDGFRTPPGDPFASDDPASIERERRRQQREAKRREREGRASLAERVSGALDGATARGRNALEQGRERVAKPAEPSPEAPEPPALRRTAPRTPPLPSPAPERPRAPERAPAPEPAPSAGAAESSAPAETERPAPAPPGPRRVVHDETDEFAPPAPVTVQRYDGPAPPPSGPPGGGGGARRPGLPSGPVWRRRLLALLAILVVFAGGGFAVSRLSGEDPAPVTKGPKKLKTFSITLPEGLSSTEMADVAEEAGVEGDYEAAVEKAARDFNFDRAGAPKGTDSLEGFLFPATYELEKGATAEDLVEKQLTEGFQANFGQVDTSYAEKRNLTTFDIVTIASMVEREVQVPEERPIVAAVIYNRLQEDMPLQIDATVRYAIDNYDEPLEPSDLEVDSPYNTYVNPGLPVGPIGNPGLDSLDAAANPTNDDYLYYVVKPGTCGEHTFTADYDEFLRASEEYDAAQAAAGGSPTEC